MGIWVGFNYFFFYSFFQNLIAQNINDLSKSIIQTVGILVSFFAVSSFFYLGKLDDNVFRVSSNFNKIIILEQELKLKMGLQKDSCEEFIKRINEFPIKDNGNLWGLEEMKRKLDKICSETTEALKEFNNFRIEFKELCSKMDSKTIGCLATSVSVFLISILLSIFAFVSSSSFFLFLSISSMIIGMILMITTWQFLYILSSSTKQGLLSLSDDLSAHKYRVILYQEFKGKMDGISESMERFSNLNNEITKNCQSSRGNPLH